uniref:(northern house mosquito) hypothetical protein n=1 Tax=Culex pipiens TaxID=7175 RepID=A0A8D8BTB4_CULPI
MPALRQTLQRQTQHRATHFNAPPGARTARRKPGTVPHVWQGVPVGKGSAIPHALAQSKNCVRNLRQNVPLENKAPCSHSTGARKNRQSGVPHLSQNAEFVGCGSKSHQHHAHK